MHTVDNNAPTMEIKPPVVATILIITGDDCQDLEFFCPYYRFIEAGYRVDVATLKGGKLECKNGHTLQHTISVETVDPNTYDLLYLPGGKAPAKLRENETVLDITRKFVRAGKPVAAICHGPQILAAAGVIKNKRIAAWPEIEGELTQAGAQFEDQPVVEDGQFVTSRRPGDLPSHLLATLNRLDQYLVQQQAAG